MTTFGEIVEPVSRNAWEDWDENIDDQYCQPNLKWQKDVADPGEVESLIIMEGRYIANTMSALKKTTLQLVNTVPEVNLKFYKAADSAKYICVLRDYDLLLSSEILQLLRPYIVASQDAVAIVTKPLVEYKTAEEIKQGHIIRSLSTSEPLSQIKLDFPKLEQPNLISGVPAGVISLREALSKSGILVVCYTECPDEYPIYEVLDILKNLNFVALQTAPDSILNSNLYT